MLLLSAFHISANLRLIVDGCNRANAIESENQKTACYANSESGGMLWLKNRPSVLR